MDDKGMKKAKGDATDDHGEQQIGRFPGDDEHGWAPDSGEVSERLRRSGDLAFEARPTQAGSRSEGGAIYKPHKGAKHVGESINSQGNMRALHKQEPGRIFVQREGADRPVGISTARFSTGVRPLPPITTDTYLGTGDQAG